MKIVVIGGSGLIGSKLVRKLLEHGHQAVPASPSSGINTLTGEGLAEVLDSAAVVVDVSNSPSIEYSIVRATHFFEFELKRIADDATDGKTVRVAPVLIQPMAAEDVASAVGKISVGSPVNGIVEVAGPQQFRLDELIRRFLRDRRDRREVITDPHARYFGVELDERTLVPGDDARLAETRFDDWLSQAGSRHPSPI